MNITHGGYDVTFVGVPAALLTVYVVEVDYSFTHVHSWKCTDGPVSTGTEQTPS